MPSDRAVLGIQPVIEQTADFLLPQNVSNAKQTWKIHENSWNPLNLEHMTCKDIAKTL
jgi:hypothetical protein